MQESHHQATLARELAFAIEAHEEQAWRDIYAAAPAAFAAEFGLACETWPETSLFFCQRIPFIHFNAVAMAGMRAPADEALLARCAAAYRERGIARFWLHLNPCAEPARLPQLLESEGYTHSGSWDRIYRAPAPLPPQPASQRELRLQRVGAGQAQAWADFIDAVYGMPTGPWLRELVDRPGWHHYTVSEAGRIVAARSAYAHGEWGWMGIDAPVPGLMTQDFEPDLLLCRQLVADLQAAGVRHLCADIEAPNPGSPAYENFASLGFEVVYRRDNYASP